MNHIVSRIYALSSDTIVSADNRILYSCIDSRVSVSRVPLQELLSSATVVFPSKFVLDQPSFSSRTIRSELGEEVDTVELRFFSCPSLTKMSELFNHIIFLIEFASGVSCFVGSVNSRPEVQCSSRISDDNVASSVCEWLFVWTGEAIVRYFSSK